MLAESLFCSFFEKRKRSIPTGTISYVFEVLDVYDEYKTKMEEISGRRHYRKMPPGSRGKLFTFRDSSGEPFPWLEKNGPPAPSGHLNLR